MDSQRPERERERQGAQVVTLSFFRFPGLLARLWVLGQMALARRPLARTPGIGFHKLLGTGTGEGFTPLPDTGVYAILATWPDRATAEAGLRDGAVFRRWRGHAAEVLTLHLEPVRAVGRWSGTEPFRVTPGARLTRPIVALTRASLKPSILAQFWRRVPAISADIRQSPDLIFKAGLGEVPWLHQVTFSVWPDMDSMVRFAYRGTAHDAAVKAVRAGGWFREELYARFALTGHEGSWRGADPFARPPGADAATPPDALNWPAPVAP